MILTDTLAPQSRFEELLASGPLHGVPACCILAPSILAVSRMPIGGAADAETATGGGAMIAWYAVHTRPQAEAKALENLLRQGYEAYLPRYRTEIRHARRRQTVLRPLFPRYLFAGIDREAMRWRPILSTVGVSDLVRSGDEPLPVAPEIVEALRAQEGAGAFDAPGPPPLAAGRRIGAHQRRRLRGHDRAAD